ncbi:hypothetical protein, partial [Hydrogenophaga sp.]|uniref:hypothetical protein n=1 Tax=Hydrogenophaga sp. TaxID=1904254 RepID=UPI0027333CED
MRVIVTETTCTHCRPGYPGQPGWGIASVCGMIGRLFGSTITTPEIPHARPDAKPTSFDFDT